MKTRHTIIELQLERGARNYGYGFNGKEKDDNQEWGGLTHYDYGFRIYNPGIARFLSVDPLFNSFPWNTPYSFAENRVIDGMDLDGKEWSKPTTYNLMTHEFNVDFDVKLKVIDQTDCAMSITELNQIMSAIQNQVRTTYSQFDKDKNINYSADIEFDLFDGSEKISPKENILTR